MDVLLVSGIQDGQILYCLNSLLPGESLLTTARRESAHDRTPNVRGSFRVSKRATSESSLTLLSSTHSALLRINRYVS